MIGVSDVKYFMRVVVLVVFGDHGARFRQPVFVPHGSSVIFLNSINLT